MRDSSPLTGHFELSQKFFFEAAHTLKRQYDSAGSRRIHGHTYEAQITLRGKPDPQTGMIMDLAQLRMHIESVRLQLDHHLLDEVPDLGPATLENLCQFIARNLLKVVPQLCEVKVFRRASGDQCVWRSLP